MLRDRWADILDTIRDVRKVAWILLSNATVESLADGVLTLAFAQAGVARGFLTGGYDKDLSAALSALFGITPRIATTLGPGGSPPPDAGPGPRPASPPPASGRAQAVPGEARKNGGRTPAATNDPSGETPQGPKDPDVADDGSKGTKLNED